MSIRWITELLGTAPAAEIRNLTEIELVDVRDLVDKAGNRPDAVKEKILAGVQYLRNGSKAVVCCDYGISRSNAVAAGILAVHNQIPFLDAVRMVQEKTGETEIKLAPLEAVRRAVEGDASNCHVKDKRTILVTGARGFIGTAVCKQLVANKFEVIAHSREQLDIEMGSTQLSLLAAQHNVDCIIHLANPRVYTSNIALGKTLAMLRNVLDVCVVRDIRLVYLSSWEVYSGYRSTCLVADESLPLLPNGPYAETKYLCETLLAHCRQNNRLRCTLLRSSPVYGLGSDKPKFIYNFIDKINQSEPILTHCYNNGLPSLDLLYVDDLAQAVTLAVNSDFIGDLNIGTGIITPIRSIAEQLRTVISGQSEISSIQINSDTACIAMDSRKAEAVLGWKSTIGIEKGLQLILNC